MIDRETMGAPAIVSLREYIEELIRQERTLREVGDANSDKALVLQAVETGRRLEILNHAHQLAVEVQATYVPREVYDNRIKADDTAREAAAAEARLTAAALATKVEEAKITAATALATALVNLNARLEPLERTRYETAGRGEQMREGKADNRWFIGIAMSVPSWLLAVIAIVYALTKGTP